MSWDLEPRGHAIVVRMRSNPVNCMNPGMFDDVHRAFDLLDAEHRGRPVVLTGERNTFSAGLDLNQVFPLFAGRDEQAIFAWFERFRAMMLRIVFAPRLTVAAVNGHAFAGGLILACACDQRLAARGGARFALNEVPIGIAFPATYLEIVRHAVGPAAAGDAALTGRTYDVDAAVAAGFMHRAVDAAGLIDAAVAVAEAVSPDLADAYAHTKKVVKAPLLERIESDACRELDREALRACAFPSSRRAQQAAVDRLRKK
jgi:enoyl-CoA hydratase